MCSERSSRLERRVSGWRGPTWRYPHRSCAGCRRRALAAAHRAAGCGRPPCGAPPWLLAHPPHPRTCLHPLPLHISCGSSGQSFKNNFAQLARPSRNVAPQSRCSIPPCIVHSYRACIKRRTDLTRCAGFQIPMNVARAFANFLSHDRASTLLPAGVVRAIQKIGHT